MRTDLYFRVPPHEDCLLQIVDLYGSQPGSLLLRNLVLAERSAWSRGMSEIRHQDTFCRTSWLITAVTCRR